MKKISFISKWFVFSLILLAVISFSVDSYATNGMQIIGTGPVVRSMGGAGSALPLDAAAVMTNPASISQLGGRVDFGASYFVPSSKYKVTTAAGYSVDSNERTTSTGPSPIPAFGLVLPVNDNTTFGVGAYGTAGMGVDYTNNLYNNTTYTNLAIMKFAPAVSYKVNSNLSIGAAVNIDYATMGYNAGRSNANAIVPHETNAQYGYGLQLGALYKINELIQVGLGYISLQDFGDFRYNTTSGEDKLSFDQPQNLILGFGITPADNIRIAADVKWIEWSATVGKDKPKYSANAANNGAWNMNWENQIVYALGLEYDATKDVKVRAGFNYG
ncbi:MAG: outer membrane protein transport protein, partial [Nitrospinae bacterium]|nr:outer membrane protein transport protein [Nitrospinota bacterium]